jgi:nucleoid-associated protein YgaU
MGRLGPGIPSLALEKAKLVVVQGKPWKSQLKFKYNPEKFTLTKTAEWRDGAKNTKEEPAQPTYQKTAPATLTMDVFFDAFEELFGDVTTDVRTLLNWTKPCPPKVKGVMNPPILELQWGSSPALRGFRGYLSSVTANYTLFRMDGTPIRATCSITLTEVPRRIAGQNPTSGSRAGVRSHVLIEGESLQSVAWTEYGNAGRWRALAEFNGIDDPLRVPAGTRLLIPEPRDAAKLA